MKRSRSSREEVTKTGRAAGAAAPGARGHALLPQPQADALEHVAHCVQMRKVGLGDLDAESKLEVRGQGAEGSGRLQDR